MRPPVRSTLFCLMFAIAAPLGAQAANADSSKVIADTAVATPNAAAPIASQASIAGAPLTGLRAGVHRAETSRVSQPLLAPSHANLGQSRALMVVGVAGLIVGAIIGGTPGTLIMVGGALVGLKGLYDYLQ